jgi:hypothetical protein
MHRTLRGRAFIRSTGRVFCFGLASMNVLRPWWRTHSCALIEGDERGLDDELATEFPREDSAIADALWYCDMTTGPHGEAMPVLERLGEIRSRYGPDHVVTRFVDRAQGEIVAAVRRTEERLRKADAPV